MKPDVRHQVGSKNVTEKRSSYQNSLSSLRTSAIVSTLFI